MRQFGPELKPIPGKIIRDKDEQGFVLLKPERAADVHPAGFSDQVEAAIVLMGLGSREAGLLAIARHPSVSRDLEASQWAGRTAQDIEQRWVRAYLSAHDSSC